MAISEADTETRIEITTHRRPIRALTLKTRTGNFRRTAIIEAIARRNAWRRIGEATLSNTTLPGLQEEQCDLRFAETRSPRLRVRIENGDNPPLEVDGVEAETSVWECRFVAAPGKAYELRYGDPGAEKPEYDVEAIHLAFSKGIEPVPAELAPWKGDILDRSGERADWNILADPSIVAIVLVLAIVVLGASLFQAARRVG